MKNTDVVKDVSWGNIDREKSSSTGNSDRPNVFKRNKNAESEVKGN
jgi:hypothetical protein